ncbi:MAG: prepilin-type N-terminal cleavage/methylation domain-containing protein [Elusimicrobium sp.]|jgi:prepilin-type N-terminal cleavage/methylation domain-containing protein|nr:prepilin-type N-terminal cleavage/methylation domain-containing protein [Elusimicrobium sp.]
MTKKIYDGFTLIEILVVVLIIGILSAVAIPQYNTAVKKSRAGEAFIQIKALKTAMDVYMLAAGQPAEKFSDLDIEIPNTSPCSSTASVTDCVANARWRFEIWPTGPAARILPAQDLVIAWYDEKSSAGLRNAFGCDVLLGRDSTNVNRQVCRSLGGVLANVTTWEYYRL